MTDSIEVAFLKSFEDNARQDIAFRYEPPLRADVFCQHCNDEIEAWAELRNPFPFVIAGAENNFAWRHVRTQSRLCVRVSTGSPHDDFAAQRAINAAQRADSSEATR